jgi:dihydrodipicolinate synthase/N-acetylneuraminate lyase
LPVIARLREAAPNLAGLKVSDTPWSAFEPYLLPDLSIFVGPERLIAQGMAGGAVGAVSALASALPELVIAAVRGGDAAASERCFAVRAEIERFPFHAAMKTILARRGVPVTAGVRRPLRGLSEPELAAFAPVADRVLSELEAPAR